VILVLRTVIGWLSTVISWETIDATSIELVVTALDADEEVAEDIAVIPGFFRPKLFKAQITRTDPPIGLDLDIDDPEYEYSI